MATIKAPRAFSSSICHACPQRLLPVPATQQRHFSSTPKISAGEDALSGLGVLSNQMSRNNRPKGYSHTPGSPSDPFAGQSLSGIIDADPGSLLTSQFANNLNIHSSAMDLPHRLHVYATKHNTHITFVQPARPASQTASSGISGTSASAADLKKQIDVLISLSAGNLGFRKAGRGSYDAGYQLGAFVMKQIQEKGMLRDVHKLEVVLRGFGAGREAVSKILLGSEGAALRRKITSVVDATRLKQGGPRSKKPRRLG